jgi:uncharacterized phage infection (PIP) family protein YhgE
MINALKQIRLSNGVLISGFEGRVVVDGSGTLAFNSELDSLNETLGADISSLSGSISNLDDLTDSLLSGQDEINSYIDELQSGVTQNAEDIAIFSGNLDYVQTGLSGLADVVADVSVRIDDLESGIIEANTDLTEAINLVGSGLDMVSGELDSLTFNFLNLSSGVNSISSGIFELQNTVEIHSVDIDYLKTGVDGAIDVLLSHQDRLSGIDAAILDLYSGAGLGDNNAKSFSYAVPSGSEDITVPFPGSVFPSVPRINVTIESEVGYLFALKNKTASGFDISFSDTIQEDNVSLDVYATIQG